MHNVKRVPQAALTPELIARHKEEEERKLKSYKTIEDEYLARRAAGDVSMAGLESTTALLTCNPEYYSAWNYRREILLHMFQDDKTSEGDTTSLQTRLLNDDLILLQQNMRLYPKVYWLWNHRRWCLQMLPDKESNASEKWRKELSLVDMMLEMDPRNFMGWNYRRWILENLAAALSPGQDNEEYRFPLSLSLPSLPDTVRDTQLELAESELRYSLRKIESNFSNFSAWHHRSKLFPCVLDAKKLSEEQRMLEREKEFELLQQAMYTDPSDQSIWIYHRWLVSLNADQKTLEQQIRLIEELAELEQDSKWCMQSLAHYKQTLLSSWGHQLDDSTKSALDAEIKHLLEKLCIIDPLRQNRYQDLLKVNHTH